MPLIRPPLLIRGGDHDGDSPENAVMIGNSRKQPVAEGRLLIDGAAREAFRTDDLNWIVISKDMGTQHATACEEDGYFPGAACDPCGQGTRRHMCRLLVALGAMVTIGPVCAHNGFLPDKNGTVFKRFDPPMKFHHSKK